MEKDKLIKMLIGFLPLLLLFLDPPEGMDPKAWGLFPFYAGAILMVMLRPVGEATALAIFLGLYAVMMRGHTVALSGFALTMTWLVVGAYIIAQAFRDTNLGKRISFWMIRIFGRSTLGLGYAAAFADFIIAPVTPSNAARTGGIIYPIFLSVAESLGSYPDKNPRGFGAYISVLLYVVTMCTGITFLTGYAANTVAWALADQMLGLHITWLQWTTAFILPAGIVLLIAPYVMYLIYRPTLTKIDNVRIAREGLAAIGPMSSKEKILLCLFVLAIIGWATSSYTKINSTAVVLGFIAVCLMTNVLKWKDIAKNSQVWTTLMWYGGILGLAGAMNQFGFFKWMAEQQMDGRTASALCGLFILQPRRTALHFGRSRIRLPISLCLLRRVYGICASGAVHDRLGSRSACLGHVPCLSNVRRYGRHPDALCECCRPRSVRRRICQR